GRRPSRRSTAGGRPRRGRSSTPPSRAAGRHGRTCPAMTEDGPASRGNVTFLGMGTMGAAMAGNLARAGFTVVGWNRSPGRGGELGELGVSIAETAAAAVANADIVVICVSDTPDVDAVLFGPDGVASGARPGTLIIDCST